MGWKEKELKELTLGKKVEQRAGSLEEGGAAFKVYVILEITRNWAGKNYTYEASLTKFLRYTSTMDMGFAPLKRASRVIREPGSIVVETGVQVEYTNVMDLLTKFPEMAPGCGVTHGSMFNNTTLTEIYFGTRSKNRF